MDANQRSIMDTFDWKTQLEAGYRARIVSNIMDMLKRHLPVSGQDGLQELRTCAQRFEEKIYTAAKSRSDYLQKISLKMLKFENKFQKMLSNAGIPMQLQVPNPGQSHAIPVPYQNQQQIPISQQPMLAQQQEQRLLALLSNAASMQHPQLHGQRSDGGDLLRHLKNNLTNTHQQGLQQQQQMLATQSGNRCLQTIPLLRDIQQGIQASTSLFQQQNVQTLSQRSLPNTSSSTSLGSTSQTGQSEEDDWKEEVYQKLKSLKELYLPKLSKMLQTIEAKIQQRGALPDQSRSEELSKLKLFKISMEHLMAFLQVSKSSVLPIFKENLVPYEKWIVDCIETNRPWKEAMSSMQRCQLSSPLMKPVPQSQSELTQPQSHVNQMNSHMQPTNFQSFVATMTQNIMASLQHNFIPSINIKSSSVNSLQQAGVSSLQQNSLNAPQQQNLLDQQQQSYQLQRTLPDSSSCSTALTGKSGRFDRQEEGYQKKKNVRKSPEPPNEPVFNCPICMDPLVEEMSTRCGHIFCKNCIKAAINAQGKCPTCRKKANVKELIRVFLPSAS